MRPNAFRLGWSPLICSIIGFVGACQPVAPSPAEVEVSAVVLAALDSLPSLRVERNAKIGTTVDRERGRQHDSYTVRAASGDTVLLRSITDAVASALSSAGWRVAEGGGVAQALNGEVEVAESWSILKRNDRDGSLHVVWDGRPAPAVFTVLVDLAGETRRR